MITFTSTFKALGVLMFATLVLLGFSTNVYEDKAITRLVLKTEPKKEEEVPVSEKTSIKIPNVPDLPLTPIKKIKPEIPSSAPRELKTLVV